MNPILNLMLSTKKDITYYAQKIVNSKSKSIEYYADKINEIRKGDKNIIHHINEIVKIQEAQESKEEAVKRYALFPIMDEQSYEFLVKQELTHWSDTELNFIEDRKFYDESPPNIKNLLDTILAFFLVGDGAISKNIIFRFLLECNTYEEQAMFVSQLHIELIHAMTYGMAAITFKRDHEALAELIESAQNSECVRLKIEFMEKWMLSDRPKYQRLVAFACVEGIFFCTLFGAIFWLRSKGKFPNLTFANELIAADESLHRDYGIHLFGIEISKILAEFEVGTPEYQACYDEIYHNVCDIVNEAINIENIFVNTILPEPIEDLNRKDLSTFAYICTDNLYVQMGYSPIYKMSNPFTWLGDISLEQKSNFYEVKVASYKKKSVADILNWRRRAGIITDSVDVYASPEDILF